jgi:DHA1 family multidrug resistance protein-like MFS transporter
VKHASTTATIAPDALKPGAPPAGQFSDVSIYMVASAVGITSMSFNVWWPFLPLYALKLGASSDAEALFWLAAATTTQGIARLISGPVWGIISDRVGRKAMFLRALFLSSAVGATAAFAQAPWMLMISLGLAGLFSGFNPAAIALVSVSVPESKLNRSLSLLAGAQYIGTMIGPAVGAGLALVFDYRYTILVTAIVPMISGLFVLFMVPADRVAKRERTASGEKVELEPFKWSFQFMLAILMYFMIFAMNQLTRFITPVALRAIENRPDVEGHSGIAFSLAGLVSAIGVLAIAPLLYRTGRMAPALAASCVLGGVGFLVMAAAGTSVLYIGGFLMVAMVLSAMTPSTNTLIAANVSRERRGTAFGVAGSAQALASFVGPAAAAVFAAVSLGMGFVLLSVLLVALGLLVFRALSEPVYES